MTYTYRLTKDTDGVTATCSEMPVAVTAASDAAAITALHTAICDHLTHVEAVAPPSSVAVPSVRLVPVEDAPRDPQGPGDSPAAE
jgi:hypothetical protein